MSNVFKWNEPTHVKKVIQLKSVNQTYNKQEVNEPDLDEMNRQAQEQIGSAKKEAQKIIDEAKNEADSIHKKITEQSNQLFEESKRNGFNEGYQKGLEEAKTEYEEHIQNAQKMVELTKDEYHSLIKSSDRDILRIALSCTEKIIHKHLEEDTSQFFEIVRSTIKETIEHSEVTIKVSPNDYGLVLEHKEQLKQMFPREVLLTIFPDSSLQEQSCIVETPIGIIDASVDTQLQQMTEKISNLYKGVE
ncbi:flagellar assembly protein FliH [Piscibacillus salipiscarius]|uniref:Flagellar assembly protein FliH n=1 Tax=Piscibacillus salipiscarius TaxID=299480 RepID=A0ABW5Q8T5_9BACI|nr:flagellar assembly protein FliH [Piscibacillus salipiscarius]